MTLDKEFVREIRKLDLSIDDVREIKEALSHRYDFRECLQKYGRAAVAVCIARTVEVQTYRYERSQIAWAMAVLAEWHPEKPWVKEIANINIHPIIIMDNSSFLRKVTTMQE